MQWREGEGFLRDPAPPRSALVGHPLCLREPLNGWRRQQGEGPWHKRRCANITPWDVVKVIQVRLHFGVG
jgi:hypothetical protein